MSYQDNPVEAILTDLKAVNKELDQVIEVRKATLLLLAINEPCGASHLEAVQEAAHTVAGADFDELLSGCDVNNMTLGDIAMELDAREDAIQEERDSFARALDKLLVYNRAQTMKWIERKIKEQQPIIKQAEKDHAIGRWEVAEAKVETFKSCLEHLSNVKAKY